MKKAQDELKRVQNTVVVLEDENSKLHQKLAELQRERQEESAKSAQQQRGLVRRINYLIQEKEKAEQEGKERNAYVAKLELKLGNIMSNSPILIPLFFSQFNKNFASKACAHEASRSRNHTTSTGLLD